MNWIKNFIMTEMWMSKALVFWIRLTLKEHKQVYVWSLSLSPSFSLFSSYFERNKKNLRFETDSTWESLSQLAKDFVEWLNRFPQKVKKVSVKGYVDWKLFSSFLWVQRFEIYLNGHYSSFKTENWVKDFKMFYFS